MCVRTADETVAAGQEAGGRPGAFGAVMPFAWLLFKSGGGAFVAESITPSGMPPLLWYRRGDRCHGGASGIGEFWINRKG